MSESSIKWTNERRKLSDLIPWPRNPRQIKTDQAKRLAESFAEFGQVETIAIGPDNGVYNGHQRLNVLAAKHGKDYEVEVRVSSRELSEKEREKLTVFLHKGAAGEWDFDTLSEWDLPDLIEWGFMEYELGLREKAVIDYDKEWEGMPEYNQEDATGEYKTIKVHFASREDMDNFSQLIGQTITDKTIYIWYPKSERMDLKQYRAKDES